MSRRQKLYLSSFVGLVLIASFTYRHFSRSHAEPTPTDGAWKFVVNNDGSSCGLKGGGVLKCWGLNEYGQVGNGSSDRQKQPVVVDGGTGYQQVVTDGRTVCGLTLAGKVKCWGSNREKQIPGCKTSDQLSPLLIDGDETYKQITISNGTTCGVTKGGTAKCWGFGFTHAFGEDSNKNTDSFNPSFQVIGEDFLEIVLTKDNENIGNNFLKHSIVICGLKSKGNITCTSTDEGLGGPWKLETVAIESSGLTSLSSFLGVLCALNSQSEAFCWGENGSGQVGNKESDSYSNYGNTPAPTDPGIKYKKIVFGEWHTCGITSDDQLKCWGSNNKGQVNTAPETQYETPQLIDGGKTYDSVAVAKASTCGITSSGVLRCWGGNEEGEIANGKTENRAAPIEIDPDEVYSQVFGEQNNLESTSGFYRYRICAITKAGALKCWDNDEDWDNGEIPTGKKPQLVQDAQPAANEISLPKLVDGPVNPNALRALVSDDGLTCETSLKGALSCWGHNYMTPNSAGNGRPGPVELDTTFNQVVLGGGIVCAINSHDQLECWSNLAGPEWKYESADGKGKILDKGVAYSKVSISIPTDNKYGPVLCALTKAGAVKCWGENRKIAAVPDEHFFISQPIPVDVKTKYIDVVADNSLSCGLTADGGIKCWGIGKGCCDLNAAIRFGAVDIDKGVRYSVLGNHCGITADGKLKCWDLEYKGSTDEKQVPEVQVTEMDPGDTYKKLNGHCAITTAGAMKCWGRFSGDGTFVDRTLAKLVDKGTLYSYVETKSRRRCAITVKGVLKCWGNNDYGALGDGSGYTQLAPVEIDPGVTYAKVTIDTNQDVTCGLTTAGETKCWGKNDRAQLGDGTTERRNKPISILESPAI